MSTYPATCLLGHRLNAFRLNYLTGTILINIGGVWAGGGVQGIVVESLSVADRLNEVPNTLIATIRGTRPIEGSIVRVVIGTQNANQPVFVGNVLRVTRRWAAANPAHVLHDIEATDPTWRLNAVLFSARYRNQSASRIAADILTRAPAGFTSKIEPGLPVLDEISFTNATIMDAFAQLANRIGGYTLCDYNAQVYLFITPESASPPKPLIASHPSLAAVTYVRDLTQIVTRAIVEGGGGNALTNVPVGSSVIPVDVVAWYQASGGFVRSGPQRLTYGGIAQGGAGVFAGAGTTPTSAPSGVAFSYPPAGGGIEPGVHQYAYTWLTAQGETLPSPIASVVTEGPRPPLVPGPGLANETDPTYVGDLTIGAAYTYAHTFSSADAYSDLDPIKESPLSVTSAITPATRPRPAAIRLSTDVGFGGFVPGQLYYWACAFSPGPGFTPTDVSNLSPLSEIGWYAAPPMPPGTPTVGATSGAVRLDIPCRMGYPYKYIHLYRGTSPATLAYMAIFALTYVEGGDQYFRDSGVTTNATYPVPGQGRASQVGVHVLGPSGTPYKWIHLWRSPANGGAGALKWINAPIPLAGGADNVYRDGLADSALSATPPPDQGLSINAVSLSGIAIGPSGVIDRHVYRTAANGTQLQLVGGMGDNAVTTYSEAQPDVALGPNVPAVDTAGIIQTLKLIPAGATEIIVTSTAPFTPSGGYVVIGSQVVRYTGVTSTALTGIPASGDGALTQSIPWGTPIATAPALINTSYNVYAIKKGDPINLVAIVDDAAAQSALAALIGGDGVRESLLQDGRISFTEAMARGRALLAAHKSVLETFSHRSRDPLTRSGATIAVDLPPPTDIHGTFRLQDVTISTFNPRGLVMPTYDAKSSSQRFTFEDLVRQMANTTPPPATGEDR